MALLAIVLTLLFVVGIHELGHAFFARLFRVKIKRIAIGFGKPLIQWTGRNGCDWAWCMWPLGGYVQLANTRISPVEPEHYERCFDKQAVWKRVVILFGGAVANFISAWLAFFLVFSFGLPYKAALVHDVQPKSIAAQAGLAAGDRFITIAGQPTLSWSDVGQELIILWGNARVQATIQKVGSRQTKTIYLDLSQVPLGGSSHSLLAGLGFSPDLSTASQESRASSFSDAVVMSNHAMLHLLYFFIMIFKQLLSGVIPFSLLLGPLGLLSASLVSLTQGLVVFLYFIATLSTAVALVNLFPFPGLDGGAVVYALLEKIRGVPVSVALELLLYRLSLVVVFLFLVQLLKNDLNHLV